MKVYMDYKIPYFVVSVGDCLSNEEAIILKGQRDGDFPEGVPEEPRNSRFRTFWTKKSPFLKIVRFFFAYF